MTICEKCGREIPTDATYCPYCGASVQSATELPTNQPPVTAAQSTRSSAITSAAFLFFIFGVILLLNLDIFSLFIGGLELVTGWGLLTLRKWSRSLGTILAAYGIFSAFITIILAAYYPALILEGYTLETYMLSAAIQLIVYALILWLLFRPNVKTAFAR